MENKFKSEKWLDEYIINYPHHTNKKLMEIYNLNENDIEYLQRRLKLKKTPELIISNRTKYKTKNDVLETAKMCHSLSNFRNRYKLGYKRAVKEGYLKEIESLYVETPLSYSTPQLMIRDIFDGILNTKSLYNDRMTIKPYELDVYYPELLLAFEYDSKTYHKNNEAIDTLKSKMALDLGILLIRITETSRRYEEDIKTQIINNLNLINNHCNIHILENDIITYEINYEKYLYNKEKIIRICNSYTNLIKFKKEEKYIHGVLSRLKLVRVYCGHMYFKTNFHHSEDEIKLQLKEYEYLSDLIKNNKKLYLLIYRNYKHLINTLKRVKNEKLTSAKAILIINKYETRFDIRNQEPTVYRWCLKHDKDLLNNLID